MVEGLLGQLGAEKKFKRRLITAYGEVVAVLRVVQISGGQGRISTVKWQE
jgi:hypothetical protein